MSHYCKSHWPLQKHYTILFIVQYSLELSLNMPQEKQIWPVPKLLPSWHGETWVPKAWKTVCSAPFHPATCNTKFIISAFGDQSPLFCSRTSKQQPGLAHSLNCMFLWGKLKSLYHCVYKWIRPGTGDLYLRQVSNQERSRKIKVGDWQSLIELTAA